MDDGIHRTGATFAVPGIVATDHYIKVPLVHGGPSGGETLEIFVRELVQPSLPAPRGNRPALLYLQGGPGHEGPRPAEASAWIKAAVNHFRVLLMDQRGTGLSAAITPASLVRRGTPQQQAEYLAHFRADSIVRDAEVVRHALVPKDTLGGRWTILGQSFGGFCCLTYLSIAPQGLVEVLLTGGLPPGIDEQCAAHNAYRSLFPKVIRQNGRYYQRFPGDVQLVHRIVKHLQSLPGGCAQLPSLGVLRPRGLQLLGMSGLGMGGGFERLHYLLESAFDPDGQLSITFLRGYENWISFDTNPLYLVLHEAIYCQGAASNWAAHAVRQEEPFATAFDAIGATEAGRPVNFTGEAVFPWMLEDLTALAPVKEATELIAAKADWGPLYDLGALAKSPVRTASATYYEDMYVSFELAQQTAARVHGMQQWITNEFMHSGVRDDGCRILEQLLGMVRGTTLIFE